MCCITKQFFGVMREHIIHFLCVKFIYFDLLQVKDKLRNDPRYRNVKREDRETLFNTYVDELRAAEQEAERAAKAKREEEV